MRFFTSIFVVAVLFVGCNGVEIRREYYAGGVLKSEAELREGLKNGQTTLYDSLGNIVSRQNFENDTLQGKSVAYFGDGTISEIVNYDKGVLSGEYFRFYSNGNIGGKGEYRKGISVRFYYQYDPLDSGKILRETYLINVNGEPMQYYIKRFNSDGTSVDEYRSVVIDVPKDVKMKDTINVHFRLFEETKFETVEVVVGDFDDDFNVKSHSDTILLVHGQADYKFKAESVGKYLLRGYLLFTNTKVYSDSTVTDNDYQYFEEEIRVN